MAKLISDARSMIGTDYLYGGEGEVPELCMSSSCTHHKKGVKYKGVDCSGFIWNILKRQGINIGRTTTDMSKYKDGKVITNKSDLVSGDIVLFPGHVGLYIGNGKMIHSPKCGKKVCEAEIKYFQFSKGIRLTSNSKRIMSRGIEIYRVLFATVSNENEANRIVRNLYTEGLHASIVNVNVNGGVYYEVVSSNSDDRELIEKQLIKAKNIGYSSACIEMP